MDERNYIQQFRESHEFANKNFLFFINTSLIISYIAGALVIQVPFINTFGIISYDYKAYLLVGVIIFIFIQIATFISHFLEILLYTIAEAIINLVCNRLNLSIEVPHGFIVIIELILFFALHNVFSRLLDAFAILPLIIEYYTLIQIFFIFFSIYLFLRLLFNPHPFNSRMGTNKFFWIIIALALTINCQKANIEPYLLTDAILSIDSYEQHIEILYLDNDTLYYKSGDKYKYLRLTKNSSIEFSHD